MTAPCSGGLPERAPVRQALPRARSRHDRPHCRAGDVRIPRELVTHCARHRHVDRRRTGARPAVRRALAASGAAYVSGISVGMLVRSPEFWPYALCSAISITSKYVIRVDGRHIWNPSNLGIVAMLVLAADTVAGLSVQWGNTLLPMVVVWAFGTVIISTLGRLHITAHLRRCRSWSLPRCDRHSPATRGSPKPRRSPGRCTSCSSSS